MITFLKKRSYDLVYMFVTQLAISLFGLALAFAVPVNQSALRIGTSVFSILFYLFLVYTRVWELGYKDCHAFEIGESGFVSVPSKVQAKQVISNRKGRSVFCKKKKPSGCQEPLPRGSRHRA